MSDQQVIKLVKEIHDLHEQQCAYADQLRDIQLSEDRKLITKCSAKPNAKMPDLNHFKTVFDQQDAVRNAMNDPAIRRQQRRAQWIVWSIVFVVCLRMQFITSSLPLIIGVAVIFGTLPLLIHHFGYVQKSIDRHIRKQLNEQGVKICLHCGYDLRGQVILRCPECGTTCDQNQSNTIKEPANVYRNPDSAA